MPNYQYNYRPPQNEMLAISAYYIATSCVQSARRHKWHSNSPDLNPVDNSVKTR